MIKIQHRSKEQLAPFIGYWDGDKIQVSTGLSKAERAFVVAHEYYHSQDNSNHWITRELKATLCPLLGCLMIVGRAIFNPKRIYTYIKMRGTRSKQTEKDNGRI